MTVSLSNMNSLSNLGDLTRKRVAVAAYYFVPGVVFASWASRIPDVKQMLHLSNGQLGSVLFAIPIGQLLMMAFSGVWRAGLAARGCLPYLKFSMHWCSSA